MKKYKQLEKRRKGEYYKCPRNTGSQWSFTPHPLQGAPEGTGSAQGPIHKPATKDSSLKSPLKLQLSRLIQTSCVNVEEESLEDALHSFTYDDVMI